MRRRRSHAALWNEPYPNTGVQACKCALVQLCIRACDSHHAGPASFGLQDGQGEGDVHAWSARLDSTGKGSYKNCAHRSHQVICLMLRVHSLMHSSWH